MSPRLRRTPRLEQYYCPGLQLCLGGQIDRAHQRVAAEAVLFARGDFGTHAMNLCYFQSARFLFEFQIMGWWHQLNH